jgi:P pilus assembly chaperone PapD
MMSSPSIVRFGMVFSLPYSLARVMVFAGIVVFSLFINNEVSGQGDLLITPRRVVFEGSKRSMDLNLANIGKDTATYAISIVQIRMNENGGFETITQPDQDQRFADKYIRFFPRSVTLGPNESQVIKVQLTKTNELTPGEYRSHFYFRAVPKSKPLGEKEEVKDSTTISIQLTPVFGITIPIIIRNGESTTKVTLSDLVFNTVNDSIPKLSLVFHRSGNMSCFGDLIVDHISLQGKITRVGTINGIAVYTPNVIRRFQFNLNKVPGVDYTTGTLRVIYSAPSDVKPVRYAEAELALH